MEANTNNQSNTNNQLNTTSIQTNKSLLADTTHQVHIIIFAKEPRPHQVKTRLIPTLGVAKATQLARSLLGHTLDLVAQAVTQLPAMLNQQPHFSNCTIQVKPWILGAPDIKREFWSTLVERYCINLRQQKQGHLGERMADIVQSLMAPKTTVICIGSDCPSLSLDHFVNAVISSITTPVTFQPALDGGYVMLALNSNSFETASSSFKTTQADLMQALFENIPWSTHEVLSQTSAQLNNIQCPFNLLEPALRDIDTAADLQYVPDSLMFNMDQFKAQLDEAQTERYSFEECFDLEKSH